MFVVGSQGHRRTSRVVDLQIKSKLDSLIEGGGQSGGGRLSGRRDRAVLMRHRSSVSPAG